MKTFARLLMAAVLLLCCHGLRADDLRAKYILKYKDIAIEQMAASGVPASITLAQGCLESANGTSTLAVQANNHFGIKCRNWNGPVIRHDDDLKDECFRSYDSAEQSFSDHSDFLRYNDRYSALFDLDVSDYKGWAYGLKKAGYATDPMYAEKLIKIIEDYQLYQYDFPAEAPSGKLQLPPPPSALERAKQVEAPLKFRDRSVGSVVIDYTFYEKYGLVYIVSNGTESYASLARQFNLFKRELLRFNDEKKDRVIPAGSYVYLQAKRAHSTKDLAKHVVEEGETMRDMSQRFGVKLRNLYKFNNIKPGREPEPGTVINLRKVKK
ncbi:MAG: glucosaminidase domain-containing protein [Bacteroidales bacterium]|nr:glucosaminidase domain-containing protein [Bacteroidales bacterium]